MNRRELLKRGTCASVFTLIGCSIVNNKIVEAQTEASWDTLVIDTFDELDEYGNVLAYANTETICISGKSHFQGTAVLWPKDADLMPIWGTFLVSIEDLDKSDDPQQKLNMHVSNLKQGLLNMRDNVLKNNTWIRRDE